MDKLIIFMPVYNEDLNIKETIEEWYPLTELGLDSKLLLIDDGSRDDSAKIIKDAQLSKENLILHEKSNSGHGATVRLGYQLALDLGADYIFQTDSDRQTSASEFLKFWEEREVHDAQLGVRGKRGDGIWRKFVSRVLSIINFFLFGEYIVDANVPFRLINKNTLEEHISHIPEDFRLSNVLLSVLLKKNKNSVDRKEISFKDREKGENSINFKNIFKEARTFLKQVRDFKRNYKS